MVFATEGWSFVLPDSHGGFYVCGHRLNSARSLSVADCANSSEW